MHYLSILFFVISSSSDSFVVGLSYGIQKIKINFLNNIIVSFIAGISTLGSMLIGKYLSCYLPGQTTNYIGSVILILFGIYSIIEPLKKAPKVPSEQSKHHHGYTEHYEDILKNPALADTDHSKNIEVRESFVLGIALSLNNIGLGIGASITGLNPYSTSLLSFLCSAIFIKLGRYVGDSFFSRFLSKYAESISGIIIILLGIYELFT